MKVDKNIEVIEREPDIFNDPESMALTTEEIKKYITLQKQYKGKEPFFSDVIVCKTNDEFLKHMHYINQNGIGDKSRMALIVQHYGKEHTSFYILFPNHNSKGLDVFMHSQDYWEMDEVQHIPMNFYNISLQHDRVSCGVVALECVKYLTPDWYTKYNNCIHKRKRMLYFPREYLPEEVLKYWQSVDGLKEYFPKTYDKLVKKRKIKFVKQELKERNHALQHKLIIVHEYAKYLHNKMSNIKMFNKNDFIKDNIKRRDKKSVINEVKGKMKFSKDFYKESKIQQPPKSDTFEMPNFGSGVAINKARNNNSRNEEYLKYSVNHRKMVQNEEGLGSKIKSIFSCCCGGNLSDEKSSEFDFSK